MSGLESFITSTREYVERRVHLIEQLVKGRKPEGEVPPKSSPPEKPSSASRDQVLIHDGKPAQIQKFQNITSSVNVSKASLQAQKLYCSALVDLGKKGRRT